MFILLMLGLSFSQSQADIVISKEKFVEAMKTALPNAFCAEKQYFRKCFKVTEDVCIKEALRAVKTCLMSMQDDMPEQFHQPTDGGKWGEKLGTCSGNGYEMSLRTSKIDSKDCKDPSKWK